MPRINTMVSKEESRVAALIDRVLLNHSIGARVRLDVLARKRFGKRFSELFVEEPSKAVDLLMEFAGPFSSKALLGIIVRAIVHDPLQAEKVVQELLRGEDETLKRILHRRM